MASAGSIPTRRAQRPTLALRRRLEKQLSAYAIVGFGLTAMPLPLSAQIIYTPSNIPLAHNGITSLDLDRDGIADFSFGNAVWAYSSRSYDALWIEGKQAGNGVGGVLLKNQSYITAMVLPPGAEVGPSASFVDSAPMVRIFGFQYGHYASGGWIPVEAGYLGLKFMISGEVHYGWALVKFPYPYGFNSGSVYGYAYESVPNQPIITGRVQDGNQSDAPANSTTASEFNRPSLGLLAAGARGVPFWRSKSGRNDLSQQPSRQSAGQMENGDAK